MFYSASYRNGVVRDLKNEQLSHIAPPRTFVREAEPMRVLHVHSGNLYGGVETTLMAQARHHDLCPAMELSFALCFSGQLSDELESLNAPIHWLGNVRVRQPVSVWRARQRLRDLLRRERFSVVVTHSAWSQAIFGPAAREAGVPLAFYMHGLAHGRHWLERWASSTPPDITLCNSRFTASTISTIYPQARAEIVYYPVTPPEQCDLQRGATTARIELQTRQDATVIIQVSRMEAWKGHALHLEALSLLKDLPDWVCWQVGGAQRPGERKYLDELKMTAARLGIERRVRFLNQRRDVARLLAAADIFCQPNTGPEPFGIAYIEALYARLPVVTTAFGGACEIVDDTCGELVLPGNVQMLATCLRRLIQDRAFRARLGSAGPSRARKLCDPRAQMERMHQALAPVAQQNQVNA